MTREVWISILVAIVAFVALAIVLVFACRKDASSLPARLERIVAAGKHEEVSCAELAASHPLVLLALGQSNAGNHGVLSGRVSEPITLIAEGKCLKASDPLPGGTGAGGSIWQRLPAELATQGMARPVVLSVLAVDASTIADWTDPQSPLASRLANHVSSMSRLGLPPDLILWQQGEADALVGTSSNDYSAGLVRLATALKKAGTNASIILALSTICRAPPNASIRASIEDATASGDHHFRLGPDTDTLSSETHRNGCHLTAEGLDSAAKMWAKVVSRETSTLDFHGS